MKTNVFKSIRDADNKQWLDWQRMTPAQRWDECARIWLESYVISEEKQESTPSGPFSAVLAVFNRYGVQYIVIGGQAGG